MKIDLSEFVEMQASNVMEQFTLVDFTKKVLELPEDEAFDILCDLGDNYNRFVTNYSVEKVKEFAEKALKKVLEEFKKESEEEELDEIEPVPEDDDLEYTIRCQIRRKNIKIEQTMGKYPEESTENYWMIGIDINSLPEEELQSLSIFDRDFW